VARPFAYTADAYRVVRRPTREVAVGDVGIGGTNPIRLQSMTTTDTRDTAATVDQIVELADAGCEIVRVTAPSITDAENLAQIRTEMRRRGVDLPLVADIHFTPNAALVAAEHVEKVRVNPGNYADRKRFEVREYSDVEYAEEIERVAERFRPLVRVCRERGVAMRIGTNHGSLSDRILNRYGDTPLGMVESALEFLDVCESEGYRDVIFSMKASNAQVAIQAYRLLAARLVERAQGEASYPFHVGVTEAGDGEDGRIKSAIGIGALLEDGIGDTLRVSLTEHPRHELPVAAALARRAEQRWALARARQPRPLALPTYVDDPYTHARRPTLSYAPAASGTAFAIGADEPVRVEVEVPDALRDPRAAAARLATSLAATGDVACEGLLVSAGEAVSDDDLARWQGALAELGLSLPVALQVDAPGPIPRGASRRVVRLAAHTPSAALVEAAAAAEGAGVLLDWRLCGETASVPALVDAALAAEVEAGVRGGVFSCEGDDPVHAVRALVARLGGCGAGRRSVGLVLRRRPQETDDEVVLRAGVDLGAPLCDGIGDWLTLDGFDDAARATDLAYRVLQGARLRTTRTEYISCPSCGRTLFDLEQTTARVKAVTSHLKGVKIAVMGCIVNGPGEMADADFGYVGSGPGRVNLYVGHEVVARNLPQESAPERLLEVIESHLGGTAEATNAAGPG